MTLEELARQVRELRDVAEIKDITYQYWSSIDAQDPDKLREVFAPGEIYITFTDLPVWRSRDHFAKSFAKTSISSARCESHFGSSPRIRITGPDSAEGSWRLNMRGYNFDDRTVMRVTGEYAVEYARVEGEWKITSFIFERRSAVSEKVLPDGTIQVPEFGSVSAEASVHLFGRDVTQD